MINKIENIKMLDMKIKSLKSRLRDIPAEFSCIVPCRNCGIRIDGPGCWGVRNLIRSNERVKHTLLKEWYHQEILKSRY